jgi:hypothetical protein
MENNLNFTYTSAHTGRTYSIEPKTQRRMVGGFDQPLTEQEYTEYVIYAPSGKFLTFCFHRDDVGAAIDSQERPDAYEHISSKFD